MCTVICVHGILAGTHRNLANQHDFCRKLVFGFRGLLSLLRLSHSLSYFLSGNCPLDFIQCATSGNLTFCSQPTDQYTILLGLFEEKHFIHAHFTKSH